MIKEKIKLAVEALEKADAVIYSEYCGTDCEELQICEPAIKALEEVLAAQEQGEPDKYAMDIECTKCGAKQSGVLTVNTTPQQRKPLTDDELNMLGDKMKTWNSTSLKDIYTAIEAKLKEKNGG